jgi:hypothetical protein
MPGLFVDVPWQRQFQLAVAVKIAHQADCSENQVLS